jgi:DNA end-binding protein Ku
MPPRSFWKGYLKFSLVSCPVAMSPAVTARERVRFNTMNAKTGNRVRSRYVDTETGKPVEEEEQVRAFTLEDGRQVYVEDEDLEAVALESTRTIDIESFVPRDSIGWIWLDAPHHLVPDDKAGEEAFAVIRDAMKVTNTVGISRVVLYRRERAVMVEPCGKGIVAWTLRYGDEVREAEVYFEGIEAEKPDPDALGLIERLIEQRTKPWSPKMVKDPVQAKLLEIIEEKKSEGGVGPKKRPGAGEAQPTGQVVSIMDALRKSVEGEKKPASRSKPAGQRGKPRKGA